jgi:hypothetical protein
MLRAPKRRWFQFSLRGLLVAVTVAGVLLAVQLSWLRQRREFLSRKTVLDSSVAYARTPVERPAAPGWLWWFGERGVKTLVVMEPGNAQVDAEMGDAKRLFPEAEVIRAAFVSGAIYAR